MGAEENRDESGELKGLELEGVACWAGGMDVEGALVAPQGSKVTRGGAVLPPPLGLASRLRRSPAPDEEEEACVETDSFR